MSLSAVTRVFYIFYSEEFYSLCQHIPVLVNIGLAQPCISHENFTCVAALI